MIGDLLCSVCHSHDVAEGNNVVICEGNHSQQRGYRQKCPIVPLRCNLNGPWSCSPCVVHNILEVRSCGIYGDNVPSIACTSTSRSTTSSSSDSRSPSSSNSSFYSKCDSNFDLSSD